MHHWAEAAGLDSSAYNKNIEVKLDWRFTCVAYTVNIPAESHVEYKTVFQRSHSGDITDAQGTKAPVIGADIIVNHPDGYDFDISPMMSSSPRLITKSAMQKIYKVEGGILPKRGFVFYLKRLKTS